jgi:hypothetical protein
VHLLLKPQVVEPHNTICSCYCALLLCYRSAAVAGGGAAGALHSLFVNRPELSSYKLGRRHPGRQLILVLLVTVYTCC